MGRVWLGTTTNGGGSRTAGSDRQPTAGAVRTTVAGVRMTEATIAVAPGSAGAVGPLLVHRSVAPSRPPAQAAARPGDPAADRRPWFRRWLSRS